MARPGRRKRADNPHAEGASRLAARLRQLRERAKKTQEEVAAAAGLSVATIRKIETGAVAEPGYFTVLAITRAIGASIADIAELARHANSWQNASVAATTQRQARAQQPKLTWYQ
jgi:transcriptional regulator with XRE-family HTH domain